MAASQSLWMEQMQQLRKVSAQDGDVEPEAKARKEATPGEILHWLLKAAMPEWTPKELKSTKSKLKSAGIDCCSDLEDSLQEKGELNQRLRDKDMKAFGIATLTRFRSQIKTHRERQRMQFLLQERRRLDVERNANVELPASSTQSTADGQEETDSLSDHEGSGSGGMPVNTNAEGEEEDPEELPDSVTEDLCAELEENGTVSAEMPTSATGSEDEGLVETVDTATSENDSEALGNEVTAASMEFPEMVSTDEDTLVAGSEVVQDDRAGVEAHNCVTTAVDSSTDPEGNDKDGFAEAAPHCSDEEF